MGDVKGSTPLYHGIVVAVASLWVLNIGLNILQGPGWALTLDLAAGNKTGAYAMENGIMNGRRQPASA